MGRHVAVYLMGPWLDLDLDLDLRLQTVSSFERSLRVLISFHLECTRVCNCLWV